MNWALAGVSLLTVVAVTYGVTLLWNRRNHRQRTRQTNGARQKVTGPTSAVHLPSDDPHWLAYSERRRAEPEAKRAGRAGRAARRRRTTAAWTAGAVAGGSDGYTDSGSSCGGGGGCGGGS